MMVTRFSKKKKITLVLLNQHIKTSKGSWSNWMLKDEHKHWKVKTVTSLPLSVYRLYMYKRSDERLACELRLMPLVWIGGNCWRPPFMNPLDGGFATKISPEFAQVSLPAGKWAMEKFKFENSILWSKGQNMDQGSMDAHFGPVPWSPCHGPGPWILFYFYRKVLDRVHGHSSLNNENWTKTEIVQKYLFDETLSTTNLKVITKGGISASVQRLALSLKNKLEFKIHCFQMTESLRNYP